MILTSHLESKMMQRYPHSTGTITGYYLTLALINSCSSMCFSLPWENIVWIAGGIAKHSFLCWLFIVDRCPTRDRLLRWGLQTAPSCLLCNSAAESRDHLFFLCPYSWNLWSRLGRRCDLIPGKAVFTGLGKSATADFIAILSARLMGY